jgi:hypothetical protein
MTSYKGGWVEGCGLYMGGKDCSASIYRGRDYQIIFGYQIFKKRRVRVRVRVRVMPIFTESL